MNYAKVVCNGYILGVGIANIGNITEEEYNEITDIFRSAPVAPTGYTYKLRADTLEWELVELPPQPVEITDSEALEIILGGVTL